MNDNHSHVLQLLASDRLDEARIYQEELLLQDPENPDLLYNQGPCYVDLRQLDLEQDLFRHLAHSSRHAHARACMAWRSATCGQKSRKDSSTRQKG